LGPWRGPGPVPGEGFYINPSRRGPAVPGGGSPGATLRRRGGSPKGASGALPGGGACGGALATVAAADRGPVRLYSRHDLGL